MLPRNDETAGVNGHLSRALSNRHIQFIALGGAIGGSLFLGSGAFIRTAGPAVLIAYAIAGIAVYFMARAMGELAIAEPAPSFTAHIDRYVGRWAGFVTGWSYWLVWMLVSIFELTAVGLLMRYWFPALPQWIPALAALSSLYIANRLAVRLFGEIEFWLTLAKILIILVLLFGGTALILLHLGPAGQQAHVGKLWNDGGFFAMGAVGFIAVIPLTAFAFGGTELIGLTAAEAIDPKRSVPKAVNGVIFRIAVFYIGSLAVIMMIVGWRSLDPAISPFVLVFDRAGFPGAAGVVNFIAVTAIISSINSGIFAGGRMLYSLGRQGDAPQRLTRLDDRHIPVDGVNLSALAMLGGVALNYAIPDQVFGYVMSVIAALLLWTWSMILIAHWRWRRARPVPLATGFTMPLFPLPHIFALTYFLLVAALIAIDPGARSTVYTAIGWIAVMAAAYRFSQRRRHV